MITAERHSYYLLLAVVLAACHAEAAISSQSGGLGRLSKHNNSPAFLTVPTSVAVLEQRRIPAQTKSNQQQIIFPQTTNKQWQSVKFQMSSQDDNNNNDNDDAAISKEFINNNNSNNNPKKFPQNYSPRDLKEDGVFGPLLPIAQAVDDATGGWGLSYADLHPATPRTPVGQVFLATNFFYAAAGLALGWQGEWFLGALTEIAGIVSFWYHYSQLEFGKNRSEVRLALLVDYFTAGSALITGGVYMIQAGIDSVPLEAIGVAGGSVLCLSLCWVWEFGYPYVFWHSLWHILSALTGYIIGQDHISKITGS